ncbi:MAG: HAD family hydrolase [Phycisphaerae bacterium]|jgi:phosphoglycolate phosphatase-like HAD superfamily hydrolase
MDHDPTRVLGDLQPRHDFFIGVDSDGCAFDTMEIKHKQCFIPNIITWWQLEPIAAQARAAAEFVNLYSKWRGINRFPALVMTFDLLREHDEVRADGVEIPVAQPLRDWIAGETRLGNAALREAVQRRPDPILANALGWSEAVNRTVSEIVNGVPPFPFVRETLGEAEKRADIVVVSATPTEALQREWNEHGLAAGVRAIAGQELGTKAEHLKLAAGGKYARERTLMIGDAPGDLKAARANGASFYPIVPGREAESWQRLHAEGLARFFDGRYAGAYEAALVADFEAVLPDTPPWKR